MNHRNNRLFATALTFVAAIFVSWSVRAAAPINLHVDLTDVPRKVIHSRMRIPVSPGEFTLLYPKWIQGEHGPTGPITDAVALKVSAGGVALPWKRDGLDMCSFHIKVPERTEFIDVTIDYLMPPGGEGFSSAASGTAHLAMINWNQVLLYPQGEPADKIQYAASVQLPAGWKYGTALPIERESPTSVQFKTASLTTLIESPMAIGEHFRTIQLAPGISPKHSLDLVADSPAALEIKPEVQAALSKAVVELGELFGARHYGRYHFLLALSDHVAHFGLEHHECSENRYPERTFLDSDVHNLYTWILCHEIVHSWNGKHRRPEGLVRQNYQEPLNSELLWVYEGLTHYLGFLISARSGVLSPEIYREHLANAAAKLEHNRGRAWRPLVDTATAAQLLYPAREEGEASRRKVDFYDEGWLIWLEAETLIREKTQSRRTLDDFCKRFFGGESGKPTVRPYNVEEVIMTLNEVAPYDWRKFFDERVHSINAHAPMGGIEASGWELVYREEPSSVSKADDADRKAINLIYSIGLKLGDDGTVKDVIPEMAAQKAGITPGMKLVAVNGRRWSAQVLRDAVKATRGSAQSLELLLEDAEFFKICKVEYQGGERHPHLRRNEKKPDVLAEILKPRSGP